MTMHDEMRDMTADHEARGEVLTEAAALEACRDAEKYPKLHAHVWLADADELVLEARLARIRSVMIRVRITTEGGDNVRLLTHVRGVPGYQRTEVVANNTELATVKMRQLAADIRSARARFVAFRRMMDADIVDQVDAHLAAAQRLADQAAGLPEQPGEAAS